VFFGNRGLTLPDHLARGSGLLSGSRRVADPARGPQAPPALTVLTVLRTGTRRPPREPGTSRRARTSREPGRARNLRTSRKLRTPRRSGRACKPRSAWSPGRTSKTGRTWKSGRSPITRSTGPPRSTRGVPVRVLARVPARWRAARSLRPGRSPPVAAERILPRGSRAGLLLPAATHSARRARRPRRLRAVRPVSAGWNPAPVRQPVLAAGHRSAVRRASVHRARVRRASVHRPRVHRTAVSGCTVGRVAAGWVRVGWVRVGRVSGRRGEAPRRAHARTALPMETGLRRHFPGAPQQVAVIVVACIVPPVRARAVVRPVGAAIAQASSPGQAIGIAAQAGVATFHQVPPGPCCPAEPQDKPYLTSVGREKSPEGPRRSIVINCT
jgi:hypothetical protein